MGRKIHRDQGTESYSLKDNSYEFCGVRGLSRPPSWMPWPAQHGGSAGAGPGRNGFRLGGKSEDGGPGCGKCSDLKNNEWVSMVTISMGDLKSALFPAWRIFRRGLVPITETTEGNKNGWVESEMNRNG